MEINEDVEIVTYGPTAFIPTIESVFETIMRIKDIRYFSIIDLKKKIMSGLLPWKGNRLVNFLFHQPPTILNLNKVRLGAVLDLPCLLSGWKGSFTLRGTLAHRTHFFQLHLTLRCSLVIHCETSDKITG
jgi:hypothetical protein